MADLSRLVVIAGPTASGKSAFGLALAEREGGTIVNADASQVYRDLRIVTARPSAEDEARAPHRLFGYRDAALPYSAADWAGDAKAAVGEVLAGGGLPILVGGTGLYLRTLLDGIAPVPPIDPLIRAEVRALSRDDAAAALAIEDPRAAERLHPHDGARVARALEVVRSTGRPLAAWQAGREGGIGGDVAPEITVLDPPVAEFYARCDARVAAMVASGAIEEVAGLLGRQLDPALPAMRAIGVREFARHLRGEIGLGEAIEDVGQATRNYAKRQRTWFKNQSLCGGVASNGHLS